MKLIFTQCLFLLLAEFAYAQQTIPLAMLFEPHEAKYAISGIGGGNIYELQRFGGSTSAQLALDYNIPLSKERHEKQKTLTFSIKYNPLAYNKLNATDSIKMTKIAFIDNQYQVFMGLRYSKLTNIINDDNKFLRFAFADFSTAPYHVNSSNPDNTGFRVVNIVSGYQLGLISNSDLGLINFNLSFQGNYISIYKNKPLDKSFEEIANVNSSVRLAHNFVGMGGKLTAQINDFVIFFEARKYWGLDGTMLAIPDLSDRVVFSIGGMAIGTVLKNKHKKN